MEFGIDTFVKLVDVIADFIKNIPKHLKALRKWIDEFFEKLGTIANQLFKGFEAVLELLYDLGVVIFEKLDPNTGKVLVGPDGVIYTLKQGDKTILEGTEAAIRKFAQKIDEIRSSGGNSKKKVQSYLDDTWKYFDKVGASQFLYKKTKEMINLYKTGRKVDFEKNVKYLSKSEVDELEIFVQYDKLVDVKGNLIDTNNSISIAEDGFKAITNRAIFVMSDRGEIYLSKLNKYGEFHHSSFLQGGKVSAAGEIVIEKGVIKEITNNSGHYRPLLKDVKENILKELENRDYLFHNGLVGEEKETVIKFINF